MPTIIVIPLSDGEDNLEADWAVVCAGVMVRRCPICDRNSIVGHGWRRKQAHDEQHDWIAIRRGHCKGCETTFTLLPSVSLPYTHYSLLARVQALHRRMVEGRSWESAAPTVKDPDRVTDPSTLRRWLRPVADAALASLHKTLTALRQRWSGGELAGARAWHSTGLALGAFLPHFWRGPLRC